MNEKNVKKERLYYIDGYKGMLCFLIMVGHFWNIYRHGGESPLNHTLLDLVNNAALSDILLLATFWLYAFLVISGYLLSNTTIKSVSEILLKLLNRFLRFFLPILGACCFIYIIQQCIGFYADETKEFFTYGWFQKYYAIILTWQAIFRETGKAMFSGSCAFNAPFWVIRDMFVSSLMIYICKFADSIYKKRVDLLPAFFMLSAIIVDNQVLVACLAGFMIGHYKEAINVLTEKIENFVIIAVAVFWCFLWLHSKYVLPDIFDKFLAYTLIHCFFLILLNRINILQRIFSLKPFLLAGKISFGVYAFHWPVICSFGSLVLIKGMESELNGLLIYVASFLVSVVFTVVISILYYFTVENFSNKIISWIKKFTVS